MHQANKTYQASDLSSKLAFSISSKQNNMQKNEARIQAVKKVRIRAASSHTNQQAMYENKYASSVSYKEAKYKEIAVESVVSKKIRHENKAAVKGARIV